MIRPNAVILRLDFFRKVGDEQLESEFFHFRNLLISLTLTEGSEILDYTMPIVDISSALSIGGG